MTKAFLSYARADGESAAKRLVGFLAQHGIAVWQDLREIGSTASVWPQIEAALEEANHLVVLVTKGALASDYVRREWRTARRYGATLVPVLAQDIPRRTLPRWLRREEIYRLDNPHREATFLATLRAPPSRLRAIWHDGLKLDAMIPRIGKLAEAKSLLLADDGGSVAISSVLAGRGGFGKTTLAAAIAQDPEVRDAYIDGIFWVTVGREAINVLPQIEDVIRAISGKSLGTTDETAAAEELARLLDHRDALLVLDDVWTEAQLRPFQKATRNASLLVTTRNREISGPTTTPIDVDELTDDEALDLISRDLSPDTHERQALAGFAKDHWNWAQLLAICNHSLVRRSRRRRALGETIDQLRAELKAGTLDRPDDRGHTLTTALDLGFDDMTDVERERVRLLATLPEDAAVPIVVLQRAWGVSAFQAEEFCIDLETACWLQPIEFPKPVRVHDNILWYLRHKFAPEVKRQAHARLLDANRPASGRWQDLPADDTYLWEQLTWHLYQSGQSDEANALLVDYDWIEACLDAVGAQALYAALPPVPDNPDVSWLRRAMGMALPRLARDPAHLPMAILGSWPWNSEETVTVVSARARMRGLRHRWGNCESLGAEVLRIQAPASAKSIAFSHDGTRIVSGGRDSTLRLWDAATGDELAVMRGHERWVQSVAFSPDGTRIVSGGDDSTLRLWDAATGEERTVMHGHEGSVNSVAFNSDGTRIVSGGGDRTLRLWDSMTGDELAVLRGHKSWVRSVAFSPDGARIASGGWDDTLRLWDAATGDELAVMRGHERWVQSVAFSPDGTRIVSGGDDRTLRLWDAATGAELATLRGHEGSVNSVAFNSDGTRIVSGGSDKTVRLWDAATGDERTVMRGHDSSVLSVALSRDRTRIVSGGDDSTLRLWDAATGGERAVLRGHEGWVRSVAFSHDGTRIVSGGDDNTLRLWDAATGGELAVLHGHEKWVNSVAFSPDGTRIVSGGDDGTLHLWDAATADERTIMRGHEGWVNSVAFSPDGTRIVSGSNDGTLRLWDAATGDELAILRGHERSVQSVAFSPDGTRIVSGGDDSTLRLWDAATGGERAVLRGHEKWVLSVAFSPDGTRIVSGGDDRSLRLWDAAKRTELAILREHESSVWSVAFSPDGTRIVSSGRDSTLCLWHSNQMECLHRLFIQGLMRADVSGSSVAVGTSSGSVLCFDLDDPDPQGT